jgi:UDP-glucose 4-epimerase
MIEAFSTALGKPIPYSIKPRRFGDIGECFADVSLAKKELGWEAERGIDEMCKDSLRWQIGNPEGYGSLLMKVW